MSILRSGPPALERPVRDIMQAHVTTVPPGLSVRELTRILADNGISGAPVVTPEGRLLGVVSASDVVRLAAEDSEIRTSSARWISAPPYRSLDTDPDDEPAEQGVGDFFLPEEAGTLSPDWGEGLEEGPFDDLTVADIMTTVPFTVEPAMTVRELASFLLRGRIHRAVVVEDDRLVGIATTMDVLGAIAAD